MRFNGERQFRFIINKLIESIGRELNSEFPIIDANIFNGSRIHAQLSPYATNGALASIRLNQNLKFDLRRIIETNTASCDLIAYIWLALECGMNIVISGAPASGKTSLLVGLACLLPRYHRIVSIEENMNEIRLGGSMINSVSLQGMTGNSKADTRSQVINSLRLRPDRIIIGEIRGAEANELFSGANIGVPFATTMHSSENGAVLVNKLISKPMSVQPQAISMLDISIFMKQDISTRRLQSITEYKWLMRGEITSETAETEKENGLTFKEILVAYNSELDFKELRHSKTIAKFSKSRLMSIANAINELKKRSQYLSEISSPENIHKNTEEFIAMYNNIED
jgi:Flp pilus assembly CpaF family ATPase